VNVAIDPAKVELYVKLGSALFSTGFAAITDVIAFARSNGADDAKIEELKKKYDSLVEAIAERAGESNNGQG
jgi:hypothetical protein